MSTVVEFHLCCHLKPDVPESVVDAISRWMRGDGFAHRADGWTGKWPNHDFFRTRRGARMHLADTEVRNLFSNGVLQVSGRFVDDDDELALLRAFLDRYIERGFYMEERAEDRNHRAPLVYLLVNERWKLMERLPPKEVYQCNGRYIFPSQMFNMLALRTTEEMELLIGSRLAELHDYYHPRGGWGVGYDPSPYEEAKKAGRVFDDTAGLSE